MPAPAKHIAATPQASHVRIANDRFMEFFLPFVVTLLLRDIRPKADFAKRETRGLRHTRSSNLGRAAQTYPEAPSRRRGAEPDRSAMIAAVRHGGNWAQRQKRSST